MATATKPPGRSPSEAHAAEVDEQYHRQCRQADNRVRERPQQKAAGNESERNAGKRGQEGRPRCRFSQSLGANAPTNSITPEPKPATRPDSHAAAGSSLQFAARGFAGSMIKNTCPNTDAVLMP